MSINIIFQQKNKANVQIPGNPKMSVSELITKYYKKVCASKKEKMIMKFNFNGNDLSPEDGSLLKDIGMKDYSSVQITLDEPMTSAPYQPPKQPEPKHEEPAQEEPPQEEPPQEEPPQEEQPQEEPPQEEQPAEEQPAEEQPAEEQPAEEQPAEEQPAEEQPAEEQPAEEQPAEEEQQDDWD